MTAYQLREPCCCAGLARSPFVLTEHISSYYNNNEGQSSVGVISIFFLFLPLYMVTPVLEKIRNTKLNWSGLRELLLLAIQVLWPVE